MESRRLKYGVENYHVKEQVKIEQACVVATLFA
jgi:hypothetical protein